MNATDHGPRHARHAERRHGQHRRQPRARPGRAARRSRPAAAASPGAPGRARASRTSLTRYAALEAAQYAANATNASSHRLVSPSLAAKSSPAKSSRFFVHWRGRSPTRAARATEPRCGDGGHGHGLRIVDQLGGVAGSFRSNRLPVAGLALELDPAAERDRQLARDREAEPRAAAVARPERPEDPLPVGRLDPRARCRRPRRRRCRWRSPSASSTRPPSGVQRKRVREQVRDDLEDAVAVGDDHRPAVRPSQR